MEVRFYTTSENVAYVAEFIKAQSERAAEKLRRQLKNMEEYGSQALRYLSTRKLTDDIWELRVSFKNILYRLMFVIRKGICWFVHAFIKKSRKTPKREIETAKNRIRDLDQRLLPALATN